MATLPDQYIERHDAQVQAVATFLHALLRTAEDEPQQLVHRFNELSTHASVALSPLDPHVAPWLEAQQRVHAHTPARPHQVLQCMLSCASKALRAGRPHLARSNDVYWVQLEADHIATVADGRRIGNILLCSLLVEDDTTRTAASSVCGGARVCGECDCDCDCE